MHVDRCKQPRLATSRLFVPDGQEKKREKRGVKRETERGGEAKRKRRLVALARTRIDGQIYLPLHFHFQSIFIPSSTLGVILYVIKIQNFS